MNFVDGRKPKPGDRVKLTCVGTWEQRAVSFFVRTEDNLAYVASSATVEVLAPPLYVNHSATEPKDGYVASDTVGALCIYDGFNHVWWDQRGLLAPMVISGATLLVRDRQPVP